MDLFEGGRRFRVQVASLVRLVLVSVRRLDEVLREVISVTYEPAPVIHPSANPGVRKEPEPERLGLDVWDIGEGGP